jgi:hypothetical protein
MYRNDIRTHAEQAKTSRSLQKAIARTVYGEKRVVPPFGVNVVGYHALQPICACCLGPGFTSQLIQAWTCHIVSVGCLEGRQGGLLYRYIVASVLSHSDCFARWRT